jgi:hypothetical protein
METILPLAYVTYNNLVHLCHIYLYIMNKMTLPKQLVSVSQIPVYKCVDDLFFSWEFLPNIGLSAKTSTVTYKDHNCFLQVTVENVGTQLGVL